MATTVFTGYSKANATLLRLQASILDWTGTSLIARQREDAPHPIRLWSFPGLPRANYVFSLDIINAGGIAIENLAYFSIVPGMLNGSINRGDEQYKVDAALSGLVSGTNIAVFDGTAGVPDFRGWSVWPSISAGPNNPLVKGVDFSWEPITGTLTLLQIGDFFQANAWWHFKFDAQDNNGSQSIPTVFDYTVRLITASDDVEYEDFANAIITEPVDEYMELTFPDITTVPVGRELKIQFSGAALSSTKLLGLGADIMPLTFGLPGESCIVYRFQRPDLSNEWKVKFTGQDKQVGTIVSNDQIQSGLLNFKRLDNVVCNIRKDARLYYKFVVNLPGAQVVAFADWGTGNNKYLYSLANGDGDFHVPDRRGFIKKSTNTEKAGDFADWAMPDHKHEQQSGTVPSTIFGRGLIARLIGAYNGLVNSVSDLVSSPRNTDGTNMANLGTEVLVKNIFNNEYVLL